MATLETPTSADAHANAGHARAAESPLAPAQQRAAMKRDPLTFLCQCADEHGDTVRLALDRDAFLLASPADVRHVLVTDRLNYYKEQTGVRWFWSIFGRSLPFLEEDEHKQARKALHGNFRPAALDALPASVQRHTARITTPWEDGALTNVAQELRRITFGVAAEFILGTSKHETAEQMFNAIQRVHRQVVARMPGPVAWPRWQPPFARARRRHRRARRKLDAFVLGLIHERRAEAADHGDVLSSLLRIQATGAPSFTDQEVRDHCVNLVLAATDPVANAVAWALYFCARDEQTSCAVADEARRVVDDQRAMTRQDLSQLTFTQQVLQEALRLRPSTWMLERQPLNDAALPSGVTMPAGARVMISPYVLHRRPSLFDKPHEFDPYHFDAEAVRKRSPYAFLPFGAGPRVCIGQPMAMAMGATMLALILQRFTFQRETEQSHSTLNGFTIQPPDGQLTLRCQPRHHTG